LRYGHCQVIGAAKQGHVSNRDSLAIALRLSGGPSGCEDWTRWEIGVSEERLTVKEKSRSVIRAVGEPEVDVGRLIGRPQERGPEKGRLLLVAEGVGCQSIEATRIGLEWVEQMKADGRAAPTVCRDIVVRRGPVVRVDVDAEIQQVVEVERLANSNRTFLRAL